MQDDQARTEDDGDERPFVDRSVNIMVGPGGISLVIATALICVTVWFVLLGMGHIDMDLIRASFDKGSR